MIGDFILRVTRWVADRGRSDWVDAMEAEAQILGQPSTMWATGCLWAALTDRWRRERLFFGAIILLPLGVVALRMALFFPIVDLGRVAGLPEETFIAVFLFLPLPFAFFLARIRPGLPTYLALPVSFLICEMQPVFMFWLEFGKSPLDWFGKNAHWYNMSPFAGLAAAFSVWLFGAWLGSRRTKFPTN